MRVLVVGGSGFIGSYTVEALKNHRYIAQSYDILDMFDMLDMNSLETVAKMFEPTWIIHLAGQVCLAPSLSNPQNDATLNIVGTLNVLEVARRHNIGVTFSSSGAIYGNNYQYPEPVSPYGISKLCLWKGSKVLTEDGWKEIKNVQVGEKVFTHKGVLNKVTNTFKRSTNELINIYLGANKTNVGPQNCQITSTPEHPFLTERGWIKASDLTYQDKIFVLSKKCKTCNKQIPYWQDYCSHKCVWHANKETFIRGINSIHRKFKGKSPNPNWNTPEGITKRIRNGLLKRGMNSQEFYLDLLIQKTVPNVFKYVGNGTFNIGTYFPDWINEERKLTIEYVGFMAGRRNQTHINKRSNFIKNAGWKTLVITEKDFNHPNEVTQKIQGFVNNPILYNDLHEVINDGRLMFLAVPIKHMKKTHAKNKQAVHNLEVENDESFIAQGMVVHNCAETYCRLYNKLYGLHTVVFRFSSVYGVGRAPTSINLIVSKALKGETIRITGDGNQTRDFTYVKDVAEALAMSAEGKFPSGTYDIGTGTATSLNHLIEILERLLDRKIKVEYIAESVGDPKRNELNVSKAAEYGFKAKISLETGIKELINYWTTK